VEKKGYREQLHLLASLAGAGLDFEAAIIGSGPMEAELKALATQLGLSERLSFTGWLDEAGVNAELDMADAFIFTGKVAQSGDRDGLPNALSEAMARGLPVMTTNVGATAEVIRNGENGFILPIDEPEAWQKALDSICNDDAFCEDLRRRARSWIEDNFDAMDNAAKLLQEVDKRLGKQSANPGGQAHGAGNNALA
jgi:glycosyltransferase involved in cell wall biosynthesis